ncbi:hypothetical protein BLOT_008740 [Blomia tropicalis]|nr:hypothetical protein BLOT_008740 [Blomia tropicalis]
MTDVLIFTLHNNDKIVYQVQYDQIVSAVENAGTTVTIFSRHVRPQVVTFPVTYDGRYLFNFAEEWLAAGVNVASKQYIRENQLTISEPNEEWIEMNLFRAIHYRK